MKKMFTSKNISKLKLNIKQSNYNLISILVTAFIFVLEFLVLFGIETIFFDEIIGLLGVILVIYGTFKRDNLSIWIVTLSILLFLIGMIPFMYNHYNRSFLLKVTDFFLTFKFVYWFTGLHVFFKLEKSKIRFSKILKLHNKIAWFLIVALTIFESYSYFVDGVERVVLASGFNGYLANLILALQISVLLQALFSKKRKVTGAVLFNILCLYNIFLTDSSTGLILSVLLLLAFFYFYFNIKFRFAVLPLIVFTIFFVYIYYDKIIMYFFSDDTARSVLYLNSIKISLLYFPFGVGLSLYGTAIAGQYYSPLYRELNFMSIWGLEENGSFLTDAYYPGILGEFGFIGFLLFLFMLLLLTFTFYRKNDKNSLFFVFCLIIPLLALNVSFNLINNKVTLLLFVLLYLIYYKNYWVICVNKTSGNRNLVGANV